VALPKNITPQLTLNFDVDTSSVDSEKVPTSSAPVCAPVSAPANLYSFTEKKDALVRSENAKHFQSILSLVRDFR